MSIQRINKDNIESFCFGMSINDFFRLSPERVGIDNVGFKQIVAFNSKEKLEHWVGLDVNRQPIDSSCASDFLHDYFKIHGIMNTECEVSVRNHVKNNLTSFLFDLDNLIGQSKNIFIRDLGDSCKDKDSNINSYFLSAIEDCTRKNKAERVTISFYFDEKQNKPKAVISDDIGAHDYCDVHVSEYMDFLATKLRLVAKSLREANCTTDPQASLSRIIQSVTNSLRVAFQCYGASKKITKDYVASVLNKKIINVLMSDDFSFKNVKKAELLSDWFDAYNFGLFETREERANCEVLLKSNTLINKMLSISELLLSNRNFENKDIDKSLNKGMIYLLNEIDDFYFTRHSKILRKASDRLLHFWSDCTSDGGISSIKSNINIELEIRSVLSVLETSIPQEATPSQAVKHKKSRLRI